MNTIKRMLLNTVFALCLTFQYGYAQQESISDPQEEEIIIDENTIIKDENGNKLPVDKAFTLLESPEFEWTMDPKFDKNGKVSYFQLRKTTEEERKDMAEMPADEIEGMGDSASNKFTGTAAPDFSVTDIEGNVISSKEAKEKIIVLNFWFTTCKPCIDELPLLNEVYEKYKDREDVVFAALGLDSVNKISQFLKKYTMKYPIVAKSEEISNLFQVDGYPTNIVIDKSGNIFSHSSGGHPGIGREISSAIDMASKSSSN